MDNYEDIFYELDPIFDGDEWDHRKISTDQTHKDDQLLMNEEQQIEAQIFAMQQVQEGDTDLKAESISEPLVEKRANPRRSHRRASTSTPQEPKRRERINAEDFNLPNGWIIEVRVRKHGTTSGHKDTYYIERSTGHVCRSRKEVLRYLQSNQKEQTQV